MTIQERIQPTLKRIQILFTLSFWKGIFRTIYLFITFFILLILFILDKLFSKLLFMPYVGRVLRSIHFATGNTAKHYDFLTAKLEGMRSSEVKRSYLINLAFKNLLAKKTRSFITIFGMAVGIGIIVFLLSLGYGIEKLVISRVASLDELRMVDVTSSDNTALRLDRTVYSKIAGFNGVETVIPQVSLVGKVTMNGATTDVLTYAVPRSYLDATKVKPIQGDLYTNNQTFDNLKASINSEGQVAGVSTQMVFGSLGQQRSSLTYAFNLIPNTAEPVWDTCSVTGSILGYTVRVEGGYTGTEYWGSEYSPFDDFGRAAYDQQNDTYIGKWMKGTVALYEKTEDGQYEPLIDSTGRQSWVKGCIQEHDLQVTLVPTFHSPDVLGVATTSASVAPDPLAAFNATVISSNSSGMEMVVLDASTSAAAKTQPKLTYSSPPDGVAVVSTGFLNLLNLSASQSIGKTFSSTFIVDKSLDPSLNGKSYTEDKKFKIIGVIDNANITEIYIPYGDIKKLGLPNVSQMKIILNNPNGMTRIRKQIETMGFHTTSTVDTVNQIESLFTNLRLLLAVIGLVALGVASLGMFNTLTVSLLERTREIGGMKTMGMVSEEVQDLFLAEAMIMGLSGGVGGILVGVAAGTLLSFSVSLIAISKGQGYLNLTYMPTSFTLFILISSFIVGILTGIYPAQRAKKISALNALRYE